MSLESCPSCARHAREPVCPFCGAHMRHDCEPARTVTRAVVIAGLATAMLATTACYGGAIPPQYVGPSGGDAAPASSTP